MTEHLLYFARHGQTDWNARGRWQGQTDIPLNEAGRSEARSLAERLLGLGIKSVASSDLSRARETAEIVSSVLGLTVSYSDALFRERAYGAFEGRTFEECRAMDPALWAAFERDPETAFADIETLASVEERMMKGLKSATLRLPSPSLIVSHGRSIRVLASRLADRPFGPIPNAGVFRFRLEMDGPIEVEPLFGTSSG